MTVLFTRTGTTASSIPATVAARLVDMYAQTPRGDPRRPAMRADAILAWTPMAYRLARMYAAERGLLDDLRQTASVGLIKAVDGFEPTRGGDFVAYAVPTIRGELKRYFRDRSWPLRAPRRLHDLNLRIEDADRRVTQRLGRVPAPADIAAHLDVPVEQVYEALQCAHARRAVSLSDTVGSWAEAEVLDGIGEEDPGFRAAEQHLDLCQALLTLDAREHRIVTLYFYGELTQREIGERLGLSQMHISRLLRGALEKLRRHMAVDR